MKFSIIVPCYNSSGTIKRALNSVVSQHSEHFDIEVIIVDDGSNDGSQDLIKLYVSEGTNNVNFHFIDCKVNSGVSFARNIGINACVGDYILFLDADDAFENNKLQRLYSLVKSNPVDFLFHSWSVEGVTNTNATHVLARKKRSFIYWNLIKNHICTPCTVIAREKIQLFDESLHRMEDLENWTRIMLDSSNIYWLDEPLTSLGHELNQGAGLSSNNIAMRKSEYEMYQILARKNKKLAFLLPFYLAVHFLKRLRDYVRS